MIQNQSKPRTKRKALFPIIKASSTEIIAAHVQQARGVTIPTRDLPLPGVWDYYSTHPERAVPATVSEQIQYRATLEEFIRFMANPRMEVRKITCQHAEKFALHLKKSCLAVDTHNRKIKRLRKIFSGELLTNRICRMEKNFSTETGNVRSDRATEKKFS